MRVHVVYAHPSPKSFLAAAKDRVVDCLRANGHQVDVLDLYAEAFNPVLTAAEWTSYPNAGSNLAGVSSEVERLRSAEALVLCFPTWWYGMPAILKGWFDRVWVPGVAFRLPPGGGRIEPGLENLRSLLVITTHGSPWWFITLGLGNPGRAVLLRGLGRLIAPGAAKRFLALYDMDRATRPRLERFLARVERSLQSFGR